MAREVSTLLWGQFLISVLAAGVHGVLGAGRGHRPLSLGSGRDHPVMQALHQNHAPSGKSSSSLPGHHHNHEEPGTSRTAAFCPHGWTRWGGNCYQYFGDTVMQPAAETLCRGRGGYMVEIESEAENKFVADLIMRSQPRISFYRMTWLGVNDKAVEGDFRLTSHPNSPLAYTQWGPGEPNGGVMGEDCVVMAPASAVWLDARCFIKAYFVCEIGSSNPVSTPKPTAVTTTTTTTIDTKTKSHKYSRITPETTTTAAAPPTVPANCNTTLCIITSGEWTNNMVG